MGDVVLQIRVKDGEVKEATADLNRLNEAANNVGKRTPEAEAYRQKRLAEVQTLRDLADAQKKLRESQGLTENASSKAAQAVEEVKDAASGASTGLLGLSGSTLAVVGGLTTLAIAAVAVVREVVLLTDATAKYVMEAKKMSEETGLALDTVAGLKLEFAAQGRSINDILPGIEHLKKLIGEAAAGSTDAKEQFKIFGHETTASIYDVTGAFILAVNAIQSTKDPVEQLRIATAAFGDETARKLIPALREMPGSFDDAKKRAAELTGQISGKNLEDAKAYTRAVAEMDAAFQGLKNTIGTSFIESLTEITKQFTGLIQLIKDNPQALLLMLGNAGMQDAFWNLIKAGGGSPTPTPTTGGKYYDPTQGKMVDRPTSTPGSPNLAALNAQKEAEEKLLKEALEDEKRTVAAKIEALQIYASGRTKVFQGTVKSIEEEFAKSGDVEKFKTDIQNLSDWMLKIVYDTYTQMEALEDKDAQLQKKNAAEIATLQLKQAARRKELAAPVYAAQAEELKKIDAAAKKLTAEQLREAEEAMRKQIELSQRRYSFDIELRQEALKNGQITEQQFLDFQNGIVLQELETRKKALQKFQNDYQFDAKKRAEVEGELKNLDEEIFQQKWRNEHALTAEAERRREVVVAIKRLDEDNANPARTASRRADLAKEQELDLKRQLQQLEDLLANGGVNDALEIAVAHARDLLDLRNRELDAVIAINRAQLELDHAMDVSSNQVYAGIKQHMAEQETLQQGIINGWNKTYDAILGVVNGPLDALDKKTKGFLSFLIEPLKALQAQSLNRVFGGILDKIFPGHGSQTDNPVARPIVSKLDQIHETLKQMQGLGGGSVNLNLGGGGAGGIGGAIVRAVTGGGGGALGVSGSHTGGSGGGGTIGDIDSILHGGGTPAGGSGGIISTIFGKGGIFGSKGFGNNVGTYSGIGAIANIVGGLVGGRAGGVISGVGSGLAIGAQIGSIIPGIGTAIGAAIGAAVGFFATIFNNPKKKQDQKENIPKLQQGFSDAMTQLQQILTDMRSLNGDPDALLSQAREIRSQIASGFGVQFGSKWGQKQSAQMIAQELAMIDRQPDGLMAQIIAAAGIARGAADRSKRILPEFAGGYFADYFKPNGLVPGSFDGADNILAMISRGEAVLNPAQMARARAAAGFDVFAHAGIPNYPNASAGPKLAGGGIAGVGMQAPEIHVHVEMRGVPIDQHVEAAIKSDAGIRTHLDVRKTLLKSGDITNL